MNYFKKFISDIKINEAKIDNNNTSILTPLHI